MRAAHGAQRACQNTSTLHSTNDAMHKESEMHMPRLGRLSTGRLGYNIIGLAV